VTDKKTRRPAKRDRDGRGRFLPRHGAFTPQIRRRYADKRYREGKKLDAIMDALVEDLGGQGNLTAGQRLLLDSIQSKLIVILQIGKYVDKQLEIIENGELIPALGKSYLAYLNSLRLALDQLYRGGYQVKKKMQTIEEIIGAEQ